MNDRITIQVNEVTTEDVHGTDVADWQTFAGAARIPAEVQDQLPSKGEGTRDGVRMSVGPARIRFRYLVGVTAAMRIIVHGETDRIMQIVSKPAILGNREGIEIMAADYSTAGDA
ncbi:head-tail adaptor protein [Massilia sp. TS11]|uniref:phage head completion protein n=1 Tax=Massilia sp. TS11 TaxID=2908003 RepID=UPI001EDBB1B7|nr:head-tail adaptor protein [Massilia sp. TS11]MCG2586494.1 head-tail adaptor protein [Massilia sp. TS11]